jgi:hypothetical protein
MKSILDITLNEAVEIYEIFALAPTHYKLHIEKKTNTWNEQFIQLYYNLDRYGNHREILANFFIDRHSNNYPSITFFKPSVKHFSLTDILIYQNLKNKGFIESTILEVPPEDRTNFNVS